MVVREVVVLGVALGVVLCSGQGAFVKWVTPGAHDVCGEKVKNQHVDLVLSKSTAMHADVTLQCSCFQNMNNNLAGC